MARPKLIDLMEKEFVSLKVHIKSSMEIFIMGSFRGKDNCILRLAIIILGNLDLIKNKAAEFIIGLGKRVMFMKGSSRLVREMEKELFGGVMEAGMKVNSEMECKAAGEFYIVKGVINNMRVTGTMACSMERESSTSRMASGMREHLNKINSMVKVYSIKTTL